MRSLLADIRYRRLLMAQVVALVGTGLTTVALALLAYDLAGNRATAVLGSALAIKMAAYVLVSPVVGAFADRVPRQSFMIAANVVRGVVVVVLPAVTQVWQIFVLIAVLQAASATFTPVFQSVLPDLIPNEDEYTLALSASQVAVSMETVLSPLLAAAALAAVNYSTLFVGTAIGFGVAAVLVAVTAVPPVMRRADGDFGARLALGLRLFRATPQLRGLMALNLVVASAGAISLVTTVNVVRDLLGGSESQVGLLLAVAGAGTATAALIAPWLARHLPERAVMLAGGGISIVAVLMSLALAAVPVWPIAILAWALIGFGPGWITVMSGRILRNSCGPPQRPALFSAQFSLSHACWLVTYPVTGVLAADAGFATAWVVLGVLAAAGVCFALVGWPRRDADVIRHRHEQGAGHEHIASARWTGRAWIHAHRVVVDKNHPTGPIPP